jgi:hypothetical protein
MVLINEQLETNSLNFLCLYPKVYKSMKNFIGYDKDANYNDWLNWKKINEEELGGNKIIVNSITFGKGVFYNYDFCGLDGWYDLFTYVYNNNKK